MAILFIGLAYVWVKGDLEWLKRVPENQQEAEERQAKAA
jgi:hypothetical protein